MKTFQPGFRIQLEPEQTQETERTHLSRDQTLKVLTQRRKDAKGEKLKDPVEMVRRLAKKFAWRKP